MKERPIIFNTDMVKAIIDGRKTVTRRPVKEQPPEESILAYDSIDEYQGEGWFFQYAKKIAFGLAMNKKHYLSNKGQCPFGQIGDQLYVRETFYPDNDCKIKYKADTLTVLMHGECWKPSIHMPKKYARIWLEITNIRVERIREIEGNCGAIRAEGIIQRFPHINDQFTPDILTAQFRDLWIDIYKDYDSNPWVWVIEFKRVER